MAGGKENPRQKMISLMYLVLIALLAINVSRDVIDAFRLVNESVLETNTSLKQKLQDTYTNFKNNYEFNPEKVKPYWEKAVIAKKLSDELTGEIEKLRIEVIAVTENISYDSSRSVTISMLKKKDDYSAPTHYFLGKSFKNGKGRARILKEKINEYRSNMLSLIDPKHFDKFTLGLNTDGPYYNADNMKESWETHFFSNTILVADITLLNKLKNDILNAQFDVVNYLHKSIGKGDFKFDNIAAKVIPQDQLVFVGEKFRAQVIAAAYDSSQSPEVYYTYGSDSLEVARQSPDQMLGENEMFLELPAQSEGHKYYKGFVRVKSAIQTVNDYPFSGEYYVSRPSYSVSPKKMNVFYIGVDNPVSIAVSGVSRDNILPSISCGTIRKDPNSKDWIVQVNSGCNKAFITISAEVKGERKDIGIQKFRVKKLPDPIPIVADKNSGIIKRDVIIEEQRLKIKMPDNFDFDHTFIIQSFSLTIQRGLNEYHYESKSAELTDEMKEQIIRTNRGQDIIFKNIIVKSSEGDTRTLPPIIFTIS